MGVGQTTHLVAPDLVAPTHEVDRDLQIGWIALTCYVAAVVALGWWSPAGLAVLVALTVLVLIHEGGHLVAARRCGVEASEYFAGFGPVVISWRTRLGLRVGLKAIPAGGYVTVVGMRATEDVGDVPEHRTYRAASRARRLAVVAAGPVVNVVFGFLLLIGAAMVADGRSAIDAVDDAWHRTTFVVTTTLDGVGAVAADPAGYGEAIVQPNEADQAPSRFLSPVGVAQLSTDLAAEGPGPLIRLMAIASIGLGVMNALPLPPLDGGHAAVVGIESLLARVRRRPELRLDTSNRVVAAVTAVTFVLVITLGASAILFDVASPVAL
jgi:membrane-associated protease RseP (regulator of RpoE activity)